MVARGRLDRVRDLVRRAELVRAPSLQTDSERTASRLELFFDLAYVLVIAELSGVLRKDLTLPGVLAFTGLFVVVWWSWISATLYANRFDHDDLVYRLYQLASMLAVIGMAASAAEATGPKAAIFAGCVLATRLLLLSQYLRAYRHIPEARRNIRLYLTGTGLGAVCWTMSLAFEGLPRYVLWGVGVLVEVVVPVLATAAPTDVPLHIEHLPERFGLFVILVLGESVAAVAHGLHDAGWTGDTLAVAAASFVVAAALWWSYFDLAGSAAKQLLSDTGGEHSSITHDVYVYGQLPLTLALAAVGVGLQFSILESGRDEPATGTRTVLAGGVALYLVAVSLTNTAMSRTWHTGWWAPLLVGLVALADALVALPAVVVVGTLAALLVVVVTGGIVQEARGRIQLEPL